MRGLHKPCGDVVGGAASFLNGPRQDAELPVRSRRDDGGHDDVARARLKFNGAAAHGRREQRRPICISKVRTNYSEAGQKSSARRAEIAGKIFPRMRTFTRHFMWGHTSANATSGIPKLFILTPARRLRNCHPG